MCHCFFVLFFFCFVFFVLKGSFEVKIFGEKQIGVPPFTRSRDSELRSTDISWNLVWLGAELHFDSYMCMAGFPDKIVAGLQLCASRRCFYTCVHAGQTFVGSRWIMHMCQKIM